MIAAVVAHTRGVNWEAVAAIAGIVAAVLVPTISWVGRMLARRSVAIAGKLDAIGVHLNAQDKQLSKHGERLARIEGAAGRVERRQVEAENGA